MKTKNILLGSTLLAAVAMSFCATSVAFADDEVPGSVTGLTGSDSSSSYGTSGTYTDSENGGSTTIGTVSKTYQRSLSGTWTSASITTTGTVGGYGITIKGATDESGNVTTDQDLYFTGTSEDHTDSLTITDLTVENGTSSGSYSTKKAFIVEGTTVILDGEGVNVTELGMNLVVGTEYGAGDATLIISNGAQVTTGAVNNTVGSNLATGTITITGENSLLATQQITLGGGVNSLHPGSGAAAGEYHTKCFVDADTYTYIRDTIVSSNFVPTSTSGSYGIVNVEKGGTWEVGVGNTDPSNNRIQLANGEINIDGEGSQLIFGKNSSLLMMNENMFSNSSTGGVYTGMNVSETVTVTNGGTVSVEEGGTMCQLVIGDTYVASNVTAAVSVDGSDDSGNASSFIISASTAVYIGTNSGYWTNTGTSIAKYDGGTADVTVSATNGGVIDISSADGMVICADNYASYIGATSDGNKYEDVGHSYGLKVDITAESGGSLTLAATNGSTVMLAAGSPAEGEYTNTLTITADGTSEDGGTASSVTISGGDIYTNFGDNGESAAAVSVEITATNGGTIALSAAKVEDTGNGVISFGLNTQVTVEKGSSLTTEGIISFESGSSISVDATSTWKTTSSVTFNADSGIEIGAVAQAEGNNDVNVSLGAVTIAEGGSVYVVIDVSSLEDNTSTSVAVLSAESVTLNTTALTDGDVTSIAAGYFTADENGYTVDSWSWDNGTLSVNITTTPEPELFSVFFGLGAIGLVATRRRRRRVA